MNIYTKDSADNLIFSAAFFQYCMAQALGDPDLKIIAADCDLDAYQTATGKAKYQAQQQSIRGLFKYRIVFQSNNIEKTIFLLVKSKTSYQEFSVVFSNILIKAGLNLSPSELANFLNQSAFYQLDYKEIKVYQLALKNTNFANFLPKVYGTYINQSLDQYIILEEYLEDAYLMSDYQDITFWNDSNIEIALKNLAELHAVYYQNYQQLVSTNWLGTIPSLQNRQQFNNVWREIANNLQPFIGNLLTKQDLEFHSELIATLPSWWAKLDTMPKTLIYNDLQIRNIAMRNAKQNPNQSTLCFYDWEVATIHLPQRDVIEFLSYLIKENVTDQQLKYYFSTSRIALEAATKQKINTKDWLEGCLYALYDFQIERLALQLSLHKILPRSDIERVWRSSRRLLQWLENNYS